MNVLGRIRPTIALAVALLALVAIISLYLSTEDNSLSNVASVAATGIVAMGRDIIASDSAPVPDKDE